MKSLFRLALIALGLLIIPSAANATAKFLIACTATCTWDNSNDTIWSTSSGGSNNTTHPIAGDTATLDANSCTGGLTCTITGGAVTLAMATLTMSACTASTTGCILDFTANNTNLNISSQFNNNGTGTNTFNCGAGTFTFTLTAGSFWNGTGTNATYSCASVAIVYQPASVTGAVSFSPKASTSYGAFSIVYPGSTPTFSFSVNCLTACTLASLSISGPVSQLLFVANITTTITAAVTWSGISSTSPMLITQAIISGNQSTITTPTLGTTLSNIAFANVKFTNAVTANNSFNLGNNTGLTINPPSGGGGGHIIGG